MSEQITGKIIKLSKEGWGFISSLDKPFTRIFFHWSGLNQDTLHFTELKVGMKVDFEVIDYIDKHTGTSKGLRAIKIEVENQNEPKRAL
jgi:cold shock CspA family protein